MILNSNESNNNHCEKCIVKGFWGEPTCSHWNCPCHTSIKEGWPTKFLNAGTENGLGDLSIMVGVVSEILTKAVESERARILAAVESKKGWSTIAGERYIKLEEIHHIVNNKQ